MRQLWLQDQWGVLALFNCSLGVARELAPDNLEKGTLAYTLLYNIGDGPAGMFVSRFVYGSLGLGQMMFPGFSDRWRNTISFAVSLGYTLMAETGNHPPTGDWDIWGYPDEDDRPSAIAGAAAGVLFQISDPMIYKSSKMDRVINKLVSWKNSNPVTAGISNRILRIRY